MSICIREIYFVNVMGTVGGQVLPDGGRLSSIILEMGDVDPEVCDLLGAQRLRFV